MHEWVQPVFLTGQHVRLEPLNPRHAKDLFHHVDEQLIRYHQRLYWIAKTPEDLAELIDASNPRNTVQFAQCLPNGEAIGITTYMNIEPENRGLEIGGTWLSRTHQGTKVNPEAKYMLLKHAFEELGAVRTMLKTDERNAQSRAAILKLGAKFEGILRKNFRMHDGYMRNTAYYSILDDEWPEVKAKLEARLAA